MNTGNLAAYLNDHLAGSVGALELLSHLKTDAVEPDFQEFCASLFAEIKEDQNDLENLIGQIGRKEAPVKQAAAWLMEKAGWIKIKLAGSERHEMGRLQALEGLELGIVGKKSLWVGLSSIRHLAATLEGFDFPRLIARAEEQIRRVEIERLKCLDAAFR